MGCDRYVSCVGIGPDCATGVGGEAAKCGGVVAAAGGGGGGYPRVG